MRDYLLRSAASESACDVVCAASTASGPCVIFVLLFSSCFLAAARSRPIQSYAIKVYEERRQESLKIMDELNNKFDKIQEVISFIEVGVVRYDRRFACVRACVRGSCSQRFVT